MALDPNVVVACLRRSGVVVHHVAPMPPTRARSVVVVFLEGNLCQFDLASKAARSIPGVLSVGFSGHNRAIMYVMSARAT
jgi:hypothetical protein